MTRTQLLLLTCVTEKLSEGTFCHHFSNNTSSSCGAVHPEATSLTATNLAVDSYTFTVKALTAVGECGTTVRSATLNSSSKLSFTGLIDEAKDEPNLYLLMAVGYLLHQLITR